MISAAEKIRKRSPRGFLPRPLLRAGNQPRFCEVLFPRKLVFSLCRVRIEAPHCLNTWRAEPQKEKRPFHFRKNQSRANPKSKEHFFFLGLPRPRGGGGAFVHHEFLIKYVR